MQTTEISQQKRYAISSLVSVVSGIGVFFAVGIIEFLYQNLEKLTPEYLATGLAAIGMGALVAGARAVVKYSFEYIIPYLVSKLKPQ